MDLINLTDALTSSKSKLIKSAISKGLGVYGIRVSGSAGVLVSDKKFASLLAKRLESELGVRGFISTDELPAYGIGKAEKKSIEEAAEAGIDDVVVMVIDSIEKAQAALKIIEAEISGYNR